MPLPRDDNNQPVQCLLPVVSHTPDADGTVQRIGPFGENTTAVEITPVVDCFIQFTDATEVITQPACYVRADGYYVYSVAHFTHLAVKADGVVGQLIVTELE